MQSVLKLVKIFLLVVLKNVGLSTGYDTGFQVKEIKVFLKIFLWLPVVLYLKKAKELNKNLPFILKQDIYVNIFYHSVWNF